MYPPLIYNSIMIVMAMACSLLLLLLGASQKTIMNSSVWATGMAAVCMTPLAVWMIGQDNRLRRPNRQFHSRMKAADVIWMLGLGASLCYVLNLLMMIFQVNRLFPSYSEDYSQILFGNPFWITVICASLLGPIAEEYVFRGLIYRRMSDYIGRGWAMVLSAFLFGVFHGNMAQFIYAFLLGLVLAWFMEYYQTIAAPILLHGAANFWSFILSYYGDALSGVGGGIILLLIVGIQFVIVILSGVYLSSVRRKTGRLL